MEQILAPGGILGILSGEELLLWGTHSPFFEVSYPDLEIPFALPSLDKGKGAIVALSPSCCWCRTGRSVGWGAAYPPGWWNPSTRCCLEQRWVFPCVFERNVKFFSVLCGCSKSSCCLFSQFLTVEQQNKLRVYCLSAKPLFLLGFLLF